MGQNVAEGVVETSWSRGSVSIIFQIHSFSNWFRFRYRYSYRCRYCNLTELRDLAYFKVFRHKLYFWNVRDTTLVRSIQWSDMIAGKILCPHGQISMGWLIKRLFNHIYIAFFRERDSPVTSTRVIVAVILDLAACSVRVTGCGNAWR